LFLNEQQTGRGIRISDKTKNFCTVKEKEAMKSKKIFSPGKVLGSTLFAILLSAAIRDQLRRPPEERTWHGTVFGIPYDFRFPTVERLRDSFWNKNTPQLLLPQAFGIGWTINFYPLLHPETLQNLR